MNHKQSLKKLIAMILLYMFFFDRSSIIKIRAENLNQEKNLTQQSLISNSNSNLNFNSGSDKNNQDINNININARNAILIDATTGYVIYEKAADQKSFPASTTKVMTALLTLEKTKDLNQKIKMSHDAIYNLERGSSHIAMNEGETLTVEQALYGLLVASAGEVANALAEYVSGNINDFCKLMNKRAKELGCKNTNFVNPHGFHNENHYTSPYDLALIMQEAIKHDEFNKIINTTRYEIPPTEKQPETRILYNTNKMIHKGKFYNLNVVGGKTGYTNEAGRNLVVYAQKNNIKLISVVMGEENFNAYLDTDKLLDYGFNKFRDLELLKKSSLQKNCVVTQKYKNKIIDIDTVNVYPEKDIILKLPEGVKKQDLKIKIKLPEKISAPVSKDSLIGKINIYYKNKFIDKLSFMPEENINLLDEKIIAKAELKKLFRKIFFMSLKILSYIALIIAVIILFSLVIRNFNINIKKNKSRSKKYKIYKRKKI